MALATVLTGAMHLDALADTADALGGGSRERALAIMRDPAVGSFGATALALALVAKTGAIADLVAHSRLGTIVAALALARSGAPMLGALLPYARPEGGLGSVVAGRPRLPRAAVAAAIGGALSLLVAGVAALWLLVAAAVVTPLAGALCRRWLGGVTGDTLGAMIEATEVACLVVATAVT